MEASSKNNNNIIDNVDVPLNYFEDVVVGTRRLPTFE